MTQRLAIGVGCRRNWPAAAIAALVECALAGRDRDGACLFTHDAKANEPSLHDASILLRLPLVFLPVARLEEVLPDVTVRSALVEATMGVPSVAEAAALAGAGPGACLVVPRIADRGATCAIAAVPA